MDYYERRKQEEKNKRRITRELRSEIEADTEAFLKNGGAITELTPVGVRSLKGEKVSFLEAVKLSGLERQDFMAANATGCWFGIRTPKAIGVKGRSYSYLKCEIEEFAKKVAEFRKGKVA